ncbi:MAG TPA: metal-sensitive transcriptional regulator [Dehalococcoidia bacterium]|nr:metal-sensitive transcriptional regulator [Dehalococcoidia bacterium]
MDDPGDELIEGVLTRLRRIEGQIRGIQRMLEEDRECEDVLTQLMAARSSLDQAGLLLMEWHITRCLLPDLAPGDPRLLELREALKAWMRFGGPVPATAVSREDYIAPP